MCYGNNNKNNNNNKTSSSHHQEQQQCVVNPKDEMNTVVEERSRNALKELINEADMVPPELTFMLNFSDEIDGKLPFQELLSLMGLLEEADPVVVLRNRFDALDQDSNGVLSRSEVRSGLARLGVEITKEDLDSLFQASESDQQQEMDFDCLLNLVAPECDSLVGTFFDILDTNQDGFLSSDELRNGLASLGQNLSVNEANEMLEGYNGRISFANFEALVAGQ